MAFKDVKQNYSIYILNKQDISITDGKVISVGFPHMDLNNKPTIGQSQMVIDVTIESNGKTATYTIPENLSVTYAGDIVLSTDKQGLIAEVESMKNTAEKILESVPKQKEVVEKQHIYCLILIQYIRKRRRLNRDSLRQRKLLTEWNQL